MPSCKLIIRDEVNIKFSGLPLEARRKLSNMFKYEKPYAKYQPAYRLGRWDGCTTLFGIGGDGYMYQLPRILPVLESMDIEITDIEDHRKPVSLEFDKVSVDFWGDLCWPAGHRFAGQPIRLREDQAEVINKFLENPQCLQEIATGFGKCLAGDTDMMVICGDNRAFNQLLGVELTGEHVQVSMLHLANTIQQYQRTVLLDHVEVDIQDLQISVLTPSGIAPVRQFIKKFNLPAAEVTVSNGYAFRAALTHWVRTPHGDVNVKDLSPGDKILHRTLGTVKVMSVRHVNPTDCFDLAIDAPHIYYDHNGVAHHNTITTATLSKICEKVGRTITIVPNKSLVEQTEEDFVNCRLDVGVYYGDRKELDHQHTICTWQSLGILDKKTKNNEDVETLARFLENVQTVIVDECHTAKASVLKDLLTTRLANAPVRWGLTGTIPKENYDAEAIFASLGAPVNRVQAHELQDAGVLARCHVNIMQLIDLKEFKAYADEVKYLVTNPDRVRFIADAVRRIANSGNTLVLVNRIDTGKMLEQQLEGSVFISGAVKTKDRKEEYDEIKTSNNKIIIATFGVAAVGINVPRIFNMVLLEPGKSFVRVIQSIGRGIRKADDKDHVEIYDITSTCKFAKRHLTERKKFYKDAKYEFTVKKLDWDM